ncbi:hypothetical protein INR49_013341 [Caranx melampygus]|nr:hypothetical protein INR49_013341 [Caranx melampygus]
MRVAKDQWLLMRSLFLQDNMIEEWMILHYMKELTLAANANATVFNSMKNHFCSSSIIIIPPHPLRSETEPRPGPGPDQAGGENTVEPQRQDLGMHTNQGPERQPLHHRGRTQDEMATQ